MVVLVALVVVVVGGLLLVAQALAVQVQPIKAITVAQVKTM
jgi:hypothetical protein